MYLCYLCRTPCGPTIFVKLQDPAGSTWVGSIDLNAGWYSTLRYKNDSTGPTIKDIGHRALMQDPSWWTLGIAGWQCKNARFSLAVTNYWQQAAIYKIVRHWSTSENYIRNCSIFPCKLINFISIKQNRLTLNNIITLSASYLLLLPYCGLISCQWLLLAVGDQCLPTLSCLGVFQLLSGYNVSILHVTYNVSPRSVDGTLTIIYWTCWGVRCLRAVLL